MVFGTARAVKSHRLGRRRKKGGSRLPVAPWIVFTLVSVLVASGLTWGFVTLLRTGCSGTVYRVTVAAASSVASSLEDLASAWEQESPEYEGQCVGVEVQSVSSADAARGISGEWDEKSYGQRPSAWVTDSQAWASWLGASEMTAGYVSSDPVVLGESGAVLAVAESKATELGWVGDEPPTWSEVMEAVSAGDVSLSVANPRTSSEGLVALLNATSDGSGGFSQEAMDAYSGAIESGSVGDDGSKLLTAYTESGDASQVMTLLDYQVEDYNATSGSEDPLVAVTPSGSSVSAVSSYMVLGGAGWVSEDDAAIADLFGDYLSAAVASGEFSDPELDPVEDTEAALAQTSAETVGATLRAWQSDTQDLNLLFLVDWSSSTMSETVEYEGETVEAGIAAIRMAVSMVDEMESTWQAGLWEYGVGAGEDGNAQEVTASAEMSGDGKSALKNDLYAISESATYEGGAPLYDSLVTAYEDFSASLVDGAVNAIVVLTNSGEDHVSQPTVDETASTLSSMATSAVVYTVGFGSANADNLALLAEATGGSYVEAPAEGGVLGTIAPQ